MDQYFNSPFPANKLGKVPGFEGSSDTAECMAKCANVGAQLKWLSIFPQGHYSVAQGFVGQRRAYFKGTQEQLRNILRVICNSHWPEPMAWCQDCLPVDVQFGAPDNNTIVFGNIADAEISSRLEGYNEVLITVTYQLLQLTDPWPLTGKPAHPNGTTLNLQVRGGGEILLVDPTAISGGVGQNLTQCFTTGLELAVGQYDNINARMRIPLTEYHITCDRITDSQLCAIMQPMPWKCREMTVNCYKFMNEDEGTLLFDTWTLDRTFVPDVDYPRRWRLSCILKCRQVPGMRGPYPENCNARNAYAIGWNHDFLRSDPGAEIG